MGAMQSGPNVKFSNRWLDTATHPAIRLRLEALRELDYQVVKRSREPIEPFLSIIVVVFDTRVEFVRECLASLSRQSSMDFETIIVDNGTTGLVRKLTDDFTERHENSTLLRLSYNFYDYSVQEILDPTALLWNAGLFVARGKASYFLSCDDLVSENYVDEIVKTFSNRPGVMTVAPRVHSVDEFGNLNEEVSGSLDGHNERSTYTNGVTLLRSVLMGRPIVRAPGGLLCARVEHVIARGGYDRVNDLTQWLKFAPYGLHGYAKSATLFWRHHSGQANVAHSRAGYSHYSNYRNLNRNYQLDFFYHSLGLPKEAELVEQFLIREAASEATRAVILAGRLSGPRAALTASYRFIAESRGLFFFRALVALVISLLLYTDSRVFRSRLSKLFRLFRQSLRFLIRLFRSFRQSFRRRPA